MSHTSFGIPAILLSTALGLAQIAVAQPAAHPTIHRVTFQPDSGVFIVTGVGLGPDVVVSLDGQPATTLPGASATQVEVMAPATVLTQPGTYRLTVVDSVRQVGDAFVVASPAATAAAGSAVITPTSAGALATTTVPDGHDAGSAAVASRSSMNGPAPLVIEDPAKTAVGYQALISNTTGHTITAVGVLALTSNTTGSENTATGGGALRENITGHNNTAIGARTLYANTTGVANTASGSNALQANTIGAFNTASGFQALYSSRTGWYNTATGSEALLNNLGQLNTATGSRALFTNTTGSDNTATGAGALEHNTTGFRNTATGWAALYFNSTGASNVASGDQALALNTTGNANTASGAWALSRSTTGSYSTAVGFNAGLNATTGAHNVYLGAEVTGTAADANTIRIGLPYDGGSGVGQNQTFIAGIWGNQVTGTAAQVFVDANGKLGTGTPVAMLNGTATLVTPAGIEQQLQDQRAINAELRDRIARLEALVAAGARRNR